MDEAIEVHRLADDKSGCLESVTGVELGVMRLNDGVGVVSFVAEDTTAVRKPVTSISCPACSSLLRMPSPAKVSLSTSELAASDAR